MFSLLAHFLDPFGFKLQALGLRFRHYRYSEHWEPYLKRSKQEQTEWAAAIPAEHRNHLGILGAGPLFDFNAEALCPTFDKITFADVDKRCLLPWKTCAAKYQSEFRYCFVELSEVLSAWRAFLKAKLRPVGRRDWGEALRTLSSFHTCISAPSESAFLATNNFDAIMSLNTLSQLPLGWHRFVESMLLQKFGRRFLDTHRDEWLRALVPSCRQIIDRHLNQLSTSSAQSILLITDTEVRSHALCNSTVELSDPLFGLEVDRIPSYFSDFDCSLSTPFEWFLVKGSRFFSTSDVIHQVRAIMLTGRVN